MVSDSYPKARIFVHLKLIKLQKNIKGATIKILGSLEFFRNKYIL